MKRILCIVFACFCPLFFAKSQFLYDDLRHFRDSLRANNNDYFLYGADGKDEVWFYLMVKDKACTKIYLYMHQGNHYVDSVYGPSLQLQFMDTLSHRLARRLHCLLKAGHKNLPVKDPRGGHYLAYFDSRLGRRGFYSGNMYTESFKKSKPYFKKLQRYMIDINFYLGMKKHRDVF